MDHDLPFELPLVHPPVARVEYHDIRTSPPPSRVREPIEPQDPLVFRLPLVHLNQKRTPEELN